jgi:hypothetical protein
LVATSHSLGTCARHSKDDAIESVNVMTTESIAQRTAAAPMAFHFTQQAQPESMSMKNGLFIGFVASWWG